MVNAPLFAKTARAGYQARRGMSAGTVIPAIPKPASADAVTPVIRTCPVRQLLAGRPAAADLCGLLRGWSCTAETPAAAHPGISRDGPAGQHRAGRPAATKERSNRR